MRKIKVTGSWGVYDAYKHIRKNNWYNIGSAVSEHDFYSIIRSMNLLMASELSLGNTVSLPMQMGSLSLHRNKKGVSLKNGKLRITYPVDWKKTKELWEEDTEAKKRKLLIRFEEPYLYVVVYHRKKATFGNKLFYSFTPVRALKRAIKENVVNRKIDTLW